MRRRRRRSRMRRSRRRRRRRRRIRARVLRCTTQDLFGFGLDEIGKRVKFEPKSF